MQKNKPFILAFIYAALFISGVCVVFYGHHIQYITHAYLIGLLLMMPFVFASIWFQKRDIYHGEIGGRVAAKEGLKFVVAATLFLVLFQAIFFEISFREFKINYMQTVGPQMIKEQILAGKMKMSESEIPGMIAKDVEGVTLFKEITSVVFKTFFYGAFSSFISAVYLKRKA
jgi:hypothetical protein